MLRSLFSGVSGMRNNQVKMDVIGNNIANINTTAFKSGRVRFQDIFSQTIKDAMPPMTDGMGGTNPRQIGLGMQVAGIDTMTNQGSLQPTSRTLDCGIEGEGYFIISSGDDASAASRTVYTRDGAFSLDMNGNLINSDGYKVMGLRADGGSITVPDPIDLSNLQSLSIPKTNDTYPDTELTSFSINTDGTIQGIYGDNPPVILGQIILSKFNNPGGLTKLGSNNFSISSNSGDASYGVPANKGFGSVQQGTLEMSNVDLANEFTEMIITSRAFQANSKTITTSDEMLQDLLNLKR